MNEVYRYGIEAFRCDLCRELWELIECRFGFTPVECGGPVLGYSSYIGERDPSFSTDIFQLILISSCFFLYALSEIVTATK